jgi:hypothetical protein
VDNRLSELTARAEEAQTQSLQARIAARTSTILSQLRRYQAMAAAHEAASKLQSTLGLDPEIGSLDDIALPDLARQIEGTLNQWQGQQSAAPVPAKSVPPAPITDRKP